MKYLSLLIIAVICCCKSFAQTHAKPAAQKDMVYELLFCDDIDLYKVNNNKRDHYPLNILFSDKADISGLKKIAADGSSESRVKVLAYNRLRSLGEKIDKKVLLGVIVEVGLDNGLDVLAAFGDGTARYLNQSGKIIIWDTATKESLKLTNDLFEKSYRGITKIGPWHKARRPCPGKDMVRITFLVSDGLYFGEGPVNVLFGDAMAGPPLTSAAELMKYLMEKAMAK